MKLRNKIMAMAIVAVAGVNVYLANDIQVQKNSLSLLNLENIAEALEVTWLGPCEYQHYDVHGRLTKQVVCSGSNAPCQIRESDVTMNCVGDLH